MHIYQQGKTIMGRLKKGEDLLPTLERIVSENHIYTGKVDVIGAVSEAKIGYYDQELKKYQYKVFNKPLEIACCTGNISLLDGEPMVHAHIVLADENGQSMAGHLAEGTIVFASEVIIQELTGEKLNRSFDKDTELTLW